MVKEFNNVDNMYVGIEHWMEITIKVNMSCLAEVWTLPVLF